MNQPASIETPPSFELALAGYRLKAGVRTQPLTRTEREVLRVLVQAAGNAVSRETLLQEIWGGDTEIESANVDNIIARLRRKLRVVGESPRLIQTIRGLGYQLVRSPDLAGTPIRYKDVREALPPLKEPEHGLVNTGSR